jgi:hypothetical protein
MQRTSQGGKEMPGNESGAGRALGISKPNANVNATSGSSESHSPFLIQAMTNEKCLVRIQAECINPTNANNRRDAV